MIVFDGHGNIAVVSTPSVGAIGGGSLTASIQLQGTGADNVKQLEGITTESGGSFSPGLTIAAEVVQGIGSDPYTGGNLNIGIGLGTPEGHVTVGTTGVEVIRDASSDDSNNPDLPVDDEQNDSVSDSSSYDDYWWDEYWWDEYWWWYYYY